MVKEIDKNGEWEVTEGERCKVRLLVKPSQSFLGWQASNPIAVSEPPIDLGAKMADLEVRIEKLESK